MKGIGELGRVGRGGRGCGGGENERLRERGFGGVVVSEWGRVMKDE